MFSRLSSHLAISMSSPKPRVVADIYGRLWCQSHSGKGPSFFIVFCVRLLSVVYEHYSIYYLMCIFLIKIFTIHTSCVGLKSSNWHPGSQHDGFGIRMDVDDTKFAIQAGQDHGPR